MSPRFLSGKVLDSFNKQGLTVQVVNFPFGKTLVICFFHRVCLSQAWWHNPVIPALRRCRQEVHEFKAILSYIGILRRQPGLHETLFQNKAMTMKDWLHFATFNSMKVAPDMFMSFELCGAVVMSPCSCLVLIACVFWLLLPMCQMYINFTCLLTMHDVVDFFYHLYISSAYLAYLKLIFYRCLKGNAAFFFLT